MFGKHFLHLLSVCLHSFPEILDRLHYHYSDFSFWKIACLHLIVVFLGFYLVPSSGTWLSAFSCWLAFCNVAFVLVVVGLLFFLLLLSALWWRRLRVLCKLPDGRARWWEKLGLALVGKALLSKALTQLFADVWGTFPGSILAWGRWGLGSMDSMVGLMANSKSGLCQRGPSQTAAVSYPIPVASPCQLPPQETLQH